MSSATPFDPDPMEDFLGLMEAAADRFDQAQLSRSRGQKLADSMERYERVVRRFEFGRLRYVAECAVQDVAGQEAGLSTEAFLQARLRLSPTEAKARVRSAQELVSSVSISGEIVEPELPATAAAASEGVRRAQKRGSRPARSRFRAHYRTTALAADSTENSADPRVPNPCGLRLRTLPGRSKMPIIGRSFRPGSSGSTSRTRPTDQPPAQSGPPDQFRETRPVAQRVSKPHMRELCGEEQGDFAHPIRHLNRDRTNRDPSRKRTTHNNAGQRPAGGLREGVQQPNFGRLIYRGNVLRRNHPFGPARLGSSVNLG